MKTDGQSRLYVNGPQPRPFLSSGTNLNVHGFVIPFVRDTDTFDGTGVGVPLWEFINEIATFRVRPVGQCFRDLA